MRVQSLIIFALGDFYDLTDAPSNKAGTMITGSSVGMASWQNDPESSGDRVMGRNSARCCHQVIQDTQRLAHKPALETPLFETRRASSEALVLSSRTSSAKRRYLSSESCTIIHGLEEQGAAKLGVPCGFLARIEIVGFGVDCLFEAQAI